MTVGCESIGMRESIAEAARKMKEQDIGALPIRADNGELCGILTDRDIATQVVGEGLDPSATEAGRFAGTAVVVQESDDVDSAMELMSIQQVRRLPVVDAHRMLVGMISQADIATHVDSRRTGQMLEGISQS
jgi:CBS domain-containing protein